MGSVSPPTVIIRADASHTVGGGHLLRCLALAECLAEEGWECIFVTTECGATLIRGMSRFETISLDESELLDPAAIRRKHRGPCDLMVFDHYGIDARYEGALRDLAKRILVIDDLANRPHVCDFLIDQTAGRESEDYRSLVPEDARILAGASYALLRPEFEKLRISSWKRRLCENAVRRILISFGATDVGNATVLALEAIERSAPEAAIDVVLTRVAANLREVHNCLSRMRQPVQLHVQTTDMAGLMYRADLAIGTAGTTSWERCCMALPSIVLIAAENQRAVAAALQRSGAACVIGIESLSAALSSLLRSGQKRLEMAGRAALLCDGLGARRVAAALEPVRARDGSAITLRPATMNDADIMLRWQSHPSVRAFARNPNVPSLQEHRDWLTRKLGDPASLLQIIEHDGEAAGAVRLDPPAKSGRREISIYLDPARLRRGIGRAALAQLSRLLPEAAFEAVVLPGNIASAELFKSAGYRKIEELRYIKSPRRA